MDSEQIRRVETAIRAAFESTQRPNDDCIALNQNLDPSDGFYIASAFRGKGWDDLTPELLFKHNSMAFLTPEAFRYYLPAYMLGALKHPSEVDIAADFLLYSLTPSTHALTIPGWFERYLGPLDRDQVSAVKLFLETIRAEPRLERDAQLALDEYWSTS